MTDLEQMYQDLLGATTDSPEGELLSTMLLQGNNEAMPQDILNRFAQLQSPPGSGPSQANGFFIPEFSQGQAQNQRESVSAEAPAPRSVDFRNPIIGEPRDVSAPGSVWRDTLNVYERTASGGVQVRQIKDLKDPQGPLRATAPEQLPTAVFEGIKQIGTIKDSKVRADTFANVVGEVDRYKTRLITDTASQIENELGVPRLLEAIRLSEAQDRRNPDPIMAGADSQITQGLRKQLDAQRQRAGLLTEQQLGRNVTLVSLQTQLKIAENAMQRMDKADAKDEALADASEARRGDKQFASDLRKEAIKEEALLSTSPQAISRAMILDPSLQGKAPEDIALYLRKTRRTPEAFEALEAPTPRLLRLSLIDGSPEAAKILAQEESAKTGEAPEVILGKLAQIKRMAEDPKEYQKMAREVLGVPAEELSKLNRASQTALTAKDKAEQKAMRMEHALTAFGKMQERAFFGNAASWVGADTELVGALNKAQQTTGKSDINSVFTSYVGDLTGQARVQKENEFYGKVRAAATQKNTSILGGVDSQAIIARLQADRAAAMHNSGMAGLINNRLVPVVRFLNPTIAASADMVNFFSGGAK